MTWTTGPWITYDSETGGVNVETDRIVAAYVGRVGGGQPTKGESFLINPGVDIAQGAIDVHGLTNEHLREHGRPPAEVLDVVAADLCLSMHHGIPVVGMNIKFDLDMLQYELARHELPTLTDRLPLKDWRCIDIAVLDKAADRYRAGSRKLLALAKHYSIDLPEESAHGAEADAMAAARVLWRIGQLATNPKVRTVFGCKPDVAEKYAAFADLTVDQLHAAQVGWHKTQAASLKKHFAGKGEKDRAASVSLEWPLRIVKP